MRLAPRSKEAVEWYERKPLAPVVLYRGAGRGDPLSADHLGYSPFRLE
jgi:hypothetical protein